MNSELDMTQYIDLFLQEAEEQIETLEQETLKLENDPSKERLQIIFRAAHTLKGSSRAMGYQQFAQLTHEMENVLDLLRNDQLKVDTEIADAVLACIDTLSQMTDSIRSGSGDAIECSQLVEQLKSFTSASPAGETPGQAASQAPSRLTPEQSALLSKAASERPVWHARFTLKPDCVMKFVRAFMAVSAIEEEGEVLITIPDREALEEEAFDTDFELFFHSGCGKEALKAKFRSISEVERFDVVEWAAQSHDPVPENGLPTIPNVAPEAPRPAQQAAPAVDSGSARKGDTGQTVRVDVARLDNLMNLVGELVIDRTRIAQIGADLSSKFDDSNIEALAETVGHIARITGDLQDQIMKARMMPIETVFNRFPRVVRDLAHKLGKDVKLELVGGDTELDRSVIEVIGDPLLHILRNSLDHGIEGPEERELAGKPRQGAISVTAKHQENHIVIDIVDDGKGIDVARIREKAIEKGLATRESAERMTDKDVLQFIFASGLSTATTVSEVSGRGVGMDIVKSNIQKLGGIIDVESVPGKGSRFSLRLPLTLAIIRGLLVKVSGVVYVVPLGSVVETLLIEKQQIQTVNGREVIVIRGVTTPLLRMRDLFTTRNFTKAREEDDLFVVVVGLAEHRLGLIVDTLIGEQEVVIKSLSRFCGDVRGVSGATILGDGNVALIMDVNGLVGA